MADDDDDKGKLASVFENPFTRALSDRLKSPFLGTYTLMFLAWNWRAWLYAIDSTQVSKKIDLIAKVLDAQDAFVIPFSAAVASLTLGPMVSTALDTVNDAIQLGFLGTKQMIAERRAKYATSIKLIQLAQHLTDREQEVYQSTLRRDEVDGAIAQRVEQREKLDKDIEQRTLRQRKLEEDCEDATQKMQVRRRQLESDEQDVAGEMAKASERQAVNDKLEKALGEREGLLNAALEDSEEKRRTDAATTIRSAHQIVSDHNLWRSEVVTGARLVWEKLLDEERANLRGADLSEANLSEANLRGTDLSEANLSLANLSDADLGGANLRGTNLGGTNLTQPQLDTACGDKDTKLPEGLTVKPCDE